VSINQYLPLYNNVSATITATRCLCRFNTLFTATTTTKNNNNNRFPFASCQQQFLFSLFPSIPFLFQKQKTKKGVEIVPVAISVVGNSLPANINAFRPSVAEREGASA
jgi:hypothetical protein